MWGYALPLHPPDPSMGIRNGQLPFAKAERDYKIH